MSSFPYPVRLLLGAGIGALGGTLFATLHLPLPWLIGALVAVAGARLAGVPAEASRTARNCAMAVVGLALGLYFTPATTAVMLANLPLLVVAALATLMVGGALALVLARLGRVDMATAWFASIPGGAADMAMLAEGYGGRPAPVAVAQLFRVCGVVILMPNIMAALGLHGDHPAIAASLPFSLPGFALLYLIGALAAIGVTRLGLKVGWLLGPLAAGALITASGHVLSGVPTWLSAGAQVLLGCQLGSAFNRDVFRRVRRFVPAALLHVLLLMAVCALVALLLAVLVGKPPGALLLGTAPGGVAEMSLTAKTLGLDVALVVSLHVIRIFLVALLTPPVFRLLLHRPGEAPAAGD
ncbi:AbrB family transcriptional regulator [Siccirubricoccus sp. KC 17139]|uniref:AbrB family transcriptional regulator n=1 Tax=Siccirubricoccus soli TaxID=2899147 RepID=A0ABT1D0U8_9PROT|nr:AbrB family transcriptional regulator [Siccirubricoccus soli]MCO6415504.1 AbrB family transcriptional regulator [Siccirubricoccus soli]MCP2681636.1 AbrB family transcriptional regulator [Siccirubricoccus soli]